MLKFLKLSILAGFVALAACGGTEEEAALEAEEALRISSFGYNAGNCETCKLNCSQYDPERHGKTPEQCIADSCGSVCGTKLYFSTGY